MSDRSADLHLHTRFSDGTETPERVVELARAQGLSTIAITDHDNIEALTLATPIARRLGLELVPGIEMSASFEGVEVHLLGYRFDLANPALLRHLATQQARRITRVREMVERLARVGVTIDAQEVLALAGEGTVGRPHVARILLKHGYVGTLAEAFDRFIGTEGPGFIPGSTVLPEVIIRLVREAGGVPVLAHPVFLKRDELIETFVRQGLAGLEVYHSSHTPDLVRRYHAIADRLHLLKTGGSDYHGDAKEGAPIGAVKLPHRFVDALKAWTPAPRP